MGKLFTPKTEFVARDYTARIDVPVAMASLRGAIKEKYPEYVNNLCERFLQATGQELKWSNISLPNLDRFVQYLYACGLADNTIRQYGSKLCAIMNRYREFHPELPSQREMCATLIVPIDESYDIYLDDDDIDVLYRHLEMLMQNPNEKKYRCNSDYRQKEIMILTHFLVSADTGARSYDERGLSWDNVQEAMDSEGNEVYMLTYTTNKRGVKAYVPISKTSRVIPLLKKLTPLVVDQRTCNKMIKAICRDAGLTRMIKRRHGGKNVVQELCDAVHFHVGRKSFATNSLKRGFSITEVMQFMGHTNPTQTMHYNCSGPSFSAEAIANQR